MIEVLKDRGASNNGSQPKQTSDSSHPDVPPINRTETTATDTNDQCQTQQSAHQSATYDPVVTASIDESPQTEGRLTDGLHLPPAIEQPKHKEPPAQNNVHDTGHADSSFSNKLNNVLKDATWKHMNRPHQRPVYGNRNRTSLTAGPRQTALFVCNVDSQFNGDAVSKYMTETDKSVVVLSTKRLIPEGQAERPTYSYKVTVCSENVEAILKPEFWPNNIGCRVFNQNHRASENHNCLIS